MLKGALGIDILSAAKPGTVYHQVYESLIKDNPGALIEKNDELTELLMSDEKYITFGSPLGYRDPKLISYDVTETFRSSIGEHSQSHTSVFLLIID